MADILDKSFKDGKHALEWVSAKYKYSKDFEKELEGLKTFLMGFRNALGNMENWKNKEWETKFKNAMKILHNVEKDFTFIGKCEYLSTKHELRLNDDLQKLNKNLPENLKAKGKEIQETLEIAIKTVLRGTSRYVGDLKKNLTLLEISLNRLHNYKLKLPEREALIKAIFSLISQLESQMEDLLEWEASLAMDIKKSEEFITELAA